MSAEHPAGRGFYRYRGGRRYSDEGIRNFKGSWTFSRKQTIETVADEVRNMGLYPYFRAIPSGQDTEVIVGGKKMIMAGSNNYVGLVNHPEVKEAMIKAIEKYGSSCTGSRLRIQN